MLSRKDYQELLVGLPHVLLVPTGYDDKLVRVLLRPAESGYSPDDRVFHDPGGPERELSDGWYPRLLIVWRGSGRNKHVAAELYLVDIDSDFGGRFEVEARFGNAHWRPSSSRFGKLVEVDLYTAEMRYGYTPRPWEWEESGKKILVYDEWYEDPTPFIKIMEEKGVEVPDEDANWRSSRKRRAKKALQNEHPRG